MANIAERTAPRAVAAIPDKTVVLTFDDAVKSHRTSVGPLLKEYGFGATFFITHEWMNDAEHFLSWEDVAALHRIGFEIGNHTWTHAGLGDPAKAPALAAELAQVDDALKAVGVPKPVSFAWPGNGFCPENLAELRKAGMKFARRGMQPEQPYGEIRLGPLYEPAKCDPLLIPTAGDAYPQWTLDHFKTVVDRARDGKIAVVQFHGVPDITHPWVHTPPERFKEYMDYLKQNGFHVIALRDVARYIDPDFRIDDPMTARRYPEPKAK
ncbi:MAG: polysaccharide deacetylase family protein [Candidatus Hydrogenedentes bacterium]|nr:polysaccharide deacetylase family protein [Candidatus Hydrogenedentota bacterium]